MQKFLVASAVLAVSVAAQANIVCQVAVDPAGEATCDAIAVIKSPPTDVTLTGDSKDLLFATITYTPTGEDASCAEAATQITPTCAAAITIGDEATEDEKKCLDAAATQGASAACGVDEGDDCSPTISCAAPLICGADNKCAQNTPQPAGEILCQVTTAAAGTPECVDVATDVTPTVTWTGGDANRKFAKITTDETTCAAAATEINQTCAAAITVGVDATEDEKKCLAADAAQGDSPACGVDEGETCSPTISCAAPLICGADNKCAQNTPQPAEIVCQITNAVPTTDECTDIAVNYVLPTGITLTGESKDHIFATITTTKDTCDEAKTDIAAACETAIVILGAPTADEAVCLADGAKQGVKKVCALANDATCTATDFCENFDKCSAQNKCAADQPQPTSVKYVWSNIPSSDKAELVKKIAELFPAEAAANFVTSQQAPCAGLGLTFEVGKIYPEQKIAFITASDAVPDACLKTVTDLKAPTAAQTSCETTCGADSCKCEEGEACTIDAQGKSNCLDGLSCKTDGTEGATTGTCNTGVMASAALAVAAALLAVLF